MWALLAAMGCRPATAVDRGEPRDPAATPPPPPGGPCGPRTPGAVEVHFERSGAGTNEVTPAWLAEHHCEVRVVDVREPEERTGALGHIAGAEHVPLRSLLEAAAAWRRDEPVVLVCRSGRRTARAVETLEAIGFRHAAHLAGGMVAWRAGGYFTTRSEAGGGAPGAAHPSPGERAIGGPAHAAHAAHAIHPTPPRRPVSAEDLRAFMSDPTTVHWLPAAALMLTGTESCIDGRDDHPVLGTPGGDAGELVLALSALETVSGRRIDESRLAALFEAYAEAFGRFYLHTDRHALHRLAESLRADARFTDAGALVANEHAVEALVRQPPPALARPLLDHLVAPEHVGCGHLRLMLQHPAEYGVRREVVEGVLRAAFRRGWRWPEALHFVVLDGDHDERAVVRVVLEREVHAYTRVPTIAPHAHGIGLFVYHPQVAAFVRRENASFLLEHEMELVGRHVLPERFQRVVSVLADHQLETTRRHLAAELPVYDLHFDGRGHASVQSPLTDDAP